MTTNTTHANFETIDLNTMHHVTGGMGFYEGLGGAAGGLIGFATGGPPGALVGAGAGSRLGGAFDALNTPENRAAVGGAAGRIASGWFKR